ncbi:hypothetical protein VTJ49DRAFT_2694 [Mycothermus thermophilus]|uniref:Uncharacterized protein n=1 Tax=Humicola insolens TaxID=85995 RepID=A0ABR3V9A6_HUMIN
MSPATPAGGKWTPASKTSTITPLNPKTTPKETPPTTSKLKPVVGRMKPTDPGEATQKMEELDRLKAADEQFARKWKNALLVLLAYVSKWDRELTDKDLGDFIKDIDSG